MGVGSQVQSFGRPHPLYMARGKGSRLYDVDGNEFIDYLLNYGPNILGHSPKPLNAALQRQLAKGYGFGEPHSLQVEVSRLLIETIPSFKVVNFNNTGSEAVQAVIRLARAATGRTKFIKFEGHYHGWLDNVFFSFHPDQGEDFGTRESPRPVIHNYCQGQPLNVLDNVVVLPWNNLEYVEKAFREHPGEIAAILTEPIMSNCGVIMPRPGYLEGLRRLATAHGAMLIFDETITGLRVSLGGAQELFGVIPDITCGFKALGGGVPIFAYGASEQLMEPVARRQAVHAGTFNANAIGCCAAKAVLQELRRNGGAAVKRINEAGRYLMQEIGHRRPGTARRCASRERGACSASLSTTMRSSTCATPSTSPMTATSPSASFCSTGVCTSSPRKRAFGTFPRRIATRTSTSTLKRVDEVFGLMKGMWSCRLNWDCSRTARWKRSAPRGASSALRQGPALRHSPKCSASSRSTASPSRTGTSSTSGRRSSTPPSRRCPLVRAPRSRSVPGRQDRQRRDALRPRLPPDLDSGERDAGQAARRRLPGLQELHPAVGEPGRIRDRQSRGPAAGAAGGGHARPLEPQQLRAHDETGMLLVRDELPCRGGGTGGPASGRGRPRGASRLETVGDHHLSRQRPAVGEERHRRDGHGRGGRADRRPADAIPRAPCIR